MRDAQLKAYATASGTTVRYAARDARKTPLDSPWTRRSHPIRARNGRSSLWPTWMRSAHREPDPLKLERTKTNESTQARRAVNTFQLMCERGSRVEREPPLPTGTAAHSERFIINPRRRDGGHVPSLIRARRAVDRSDGRRAQQARRAPARTAAEADSSRARSSAGGRGAATHRQAD